MVTSVIANASLTRLSNHIESINNSDLLEFLSFERPIKDYYLKYFDWKRRKIYMKTLFKMTSGKKNRTHIVFLGDILLKKKNMPQFHKN